MKNISILGSTGSIGRSTLSVVDSLDTRFTVKALAAGRDIDRLSEQVAKYRPAFVSVASEKDVSVLMKRLRDRGVRAKPEISYGEEGLVGAACCEGVDVVVSATVGAVGFLPTYRAL